VGVDPFAGSFDEVFTVLCVGLFTFFGVIGITFEDPEAPVFGVPDFCVFS